MRTLDIALLKALEKQVKEGKEPDLKKAKLEKKAMSEVREAEMVARNKMIVSISIFHILTQALIEAIHNLPSNCKLNYENIDKALKLILKDVDFNENILYIPTTGKKSEAKKAEGALNNTMVMVNAVLLALRSNFMLKTNEILELNDMIIKYLEDKNLLVNGDVNYKYREL